MKMDKAFELIREAASKIGIEAARLWPQMVLFYWLETLLSIITVPLVVWLLAFIGNRFIRCGLAYEGESYRAENRRLGHLVPGVVLAAAAGVIGIVYLLLLPSFIGTIFYPEAALIKSLVPSK